MSTILVTGATGYLGTHLLARLATDPDLKLLGLLRTAPETAPGWTPIIGTMLEMDFERLLQDIQVDGIFHFAAEKRTASYETQVETTVNGTFRLLEAVGKFAPEARVVIPGSAAEYGPSDEPAVEASFAHPASDYGLAKMSQTQLATAMSQYENVQVCVGRIFNVYGETPPNLAIAALARRIALLELEQPAHPVLEAFNLQSVRDFVHREDVISALIQLATEGRTGQIYNIGSGQGHPLHEVLGHLLSLSTLQDVQVQTHGDQVPDTSIADIHKIQSELGWQPSVSLVDGLAYELNYWRQQVKTLDPAGV